MVMEVTGIVFICVIFAILIALIGFCCLKFCSSEDKYERNGATTTCAPILPASTIATVYGNQFVVYPPTILPKKSSPLDVGNKQITVGIEPHSKSGCNLPSPPAPGFAVGKTQSAPYPPIISAFPPIPPPIGFGYPDVTNPDTSRSQCPYPAASETICRIPSPKPEMHRASYSPRTSSYFAEGAGPTLGFSAFETAKNFPQPCPPSYSEAVREHHFPTVSNSAKEGFSEQKSYR